MFHSPATLALAEFERLLNERQTRAPERLATPEEKALRGRIERLRNELEGLPESERIRRVTTEIFFGQNFPELTPDHARLYRQARTSWAANLLGGLGALTHPLTALLLPIVVRGGWDVGRMAQPLPHFISDEWSVGVLRGLYPGATPTAFPTAKDFLDSWRDLLGRQSRHELGVAQAYVLSGVPHHVFEGTENDLLVRAPFSDAAYVAAMGRLPVEALVALLLGRAGAAVDRLSGEPSIEKHAGWGAIRKWLAVVAAPAVGLASPVAALSIAGASATAAGLYEQFPPHRAAHRPFSEVSLAELVLQMQGLITTRAEHQEHHKPEHAVHFSGSTRWVDRIFDEGGFPSLLNLAAYAYTQESKQRIIPTSWARDPSRLEKLVGEPLPLEHARSIAAAKASLVKVHGALRGAMRSNDKQAVLEQSAANSALPALEQALDHPNLKSLFPAGATALDVYVELRHHVDGVRLDIDTVKAVLTGPPLEEKFVRELTPQTPSEAWPVLTREQVRRAVARLRDRYEPGREAPPDTMEP